MVTPSDENTEVAPLLQGNTQPKRLSKTQKNVEHIQFLALCWSMFLIGWNDASIGPLLFRIQQVYYVDYATVSWIFVFSCVGVLMGAVIYMPLNDRLGFGKMLVFASLFQIVGFSIQALAPPFPVFVASFTIVGTGVSIQGALGNGYIATVKHDGEIKMGLLQAAYGLGAFISPLSATQFSQITNWSFHYLVSLVLSVSCLLILAAVFRFKGQDECLVEAGETLPEIIEVAEGSKYGQVLRLKAVHLLALFLILYLGVQVTIGGWIVTFMMAVRGGGPASGYVASGFYGGVTLGRVILIRVNQRIGEVRALYLYSILALLLQLVVWFVPSFIVSAIAVCLVGVVIGPMYPISIRHSARVIPRPLVTGSIGWIAACGAAGSALIPYSMGMLASRYGIESLQPLVVVLMVVIGGVWALVPKKSLPGQD